MNHTSSSSSSLPSISNFNASLGQKRNTDIASITPIPIHGAGSDNVYSRHSAWVHPADMNHNHFQAGFMPKLPWRKGKWTEEEEIFTKKLIDAFNGGYLKVSSSTTLRSFLAERLCCDPMRITKKFAGSSCIGKQVCVAGDGVIDEKKMIQIQEELKSLEETFISKVEHLHKLSHRHSVNPLLARIPMDGGHHRVHHPSHPNQVAGYPTLYYPCQLQHPPPHHGNMIPQSLMDTRGPISHCLPEDAYSYACYPDNRNGGYHSEAPSFDANNFTQNPQLLLRRLQHHHHVPKCNPPTPVYRPRQAHTSADLFGRQYPTTIEQMTLLSSENLRKKLAADNTVPSNGYNTGGRMGDAAKFCSAAAHAYSEQSQGGSVLNRIKIENLSKPLVVLNSSSSNISFVTESSEDKASEIKQVDLEASNLLLNFFKSAGSGSSSKAKEGNGSTCGSSGSGSTSNQGEPDGDDSVSTFSDINEADRSVSVSGRSSSTASERSEGNSDVDYSSPDDNECNLLPQILYPVEPKIDSSFDKNNIPFEDKYVCKKQKLN